MYCQGRLLLAGVPGHRLRVPEAHRVALQARRAEGPARLFYHEGGHRHRRLFPDRPDREHDRAVALEDRDLRVSIRTAVHPHRDEGAGVCAPVEKCGGWQSIKTNPYPFRSGDSRC